MLSNFEITKYNKKYEIHTPFYTQFSNLWVNNISGNNTLKIKNKCIWDLVVNINNHLFPLHLKIRNYNRKNCV